MSELPPVRRTNKRKGTKKRQSLGIRPLWVIAGIAGVSLLSLGICLFSSWGNLRQWATQQYLTQQFEKRMGSKATRVSAPDEQQPWRVIRDADGLFEIELKGWVVEGRGQQNGVNTRDIFAFDPAKSQSFSVSVFQLKPEQVANPEIVHRIIHNTYRGFYSQFDAIPITWQGYHGFECRGTVNPAISEMKSRYSRDLIVKGFWISLSADSPFGPYDEAEAMRAANSFKAF